jgi:hypothetical protein
MSDICICYLYRKLFIVLNDKNGFLLLKENLIFELQMRFSSGLQRRIYSSTVRILSVFPLDVIIGPGYSSVVNVTSVRIRDPEWVYSGSRIPNSYF